MIAYKVVGKRAKISMNMVTILYFNEMKYTDLIEISKRNKYVKRVVDNYLFRYIKGSIIKSREGSSGIFCFKKIDQARQFIDNIMFGMDIDKDIFKIIKVRGIGKGIVPEEIETILPTTICIDDSLKTVKINKGKTSPPLGTICFKSVEVLE